MAAVHPGDGGGVDRSCVDAERGVTLSDAAVAPAADDLKHDAGVMIVVSRGWRTPRGWPIGSSEGLKTDLAHPEPADCPLSDGIGKVSKHYPQA